MKEGLTEGSKNFNKEGREGGQQGNWQGNKEKKWTKKERVKEEGNGVKKSSEQHFLCSVPRARLPRITIDHRLRILKICRCRNTTETPRDELSLLTATAAPLNQRPHKHKAAAIQMGGGVMRWGQRVTRVTGVEDSLSLCALTQQISSQRSYCEPSRAHQSSASVLLRKTRDVGLNRCTQNISKFTLLQLQLQMKAPKPAVPLTASRSNSACVAENSIVCKVYSGSCSGGGCSS